MEAQGEREAEINKMNEAAGAETERLNKQNKNTGSKVAKVHKLFPEMQAHPCSHNEMAAKVLVQNSQVMLSGRNAERHQQQRGGENQRYMRWLNSREGQKRSKQPS